MARIQSTETTTEASAPATNTPPTVKAEPKLSVVTSGAMVTIGRDDLRSSLGAMLHVIDKGSTMPMLSHVMIRASAGQITMIGTDLNVSLTVEIPCTTRSTGAACIPAKRLHDVVKVLPDVPVDLDLNYSDDRGARGSRLVADRVNARMLSLHDREFPKVPDHKAESLVWTVMASSSVVEMIDSVLFSVCKDESRFHLNGISVEADGELVRMITTDGHRLTKVERPLSGLKLDSGRIIPAKGAAEIRRMLSAMGTVTCEIAFDEKRMQVFVRCGAPTAIRACLAIKLIDAQFPRWEQVVPAPKSLATLDRETMIAALKRAKTLTTETRGVRLEFTTGTMAIVADDPDTGDVRETIDADYQGKDFKIGFSPVYVLELLSRIEGDKVVIGLGANDLDPATFRSEYDATQRPFIDAYLVGVVMPMRI